MLILQQIVFAKTTQSILSGIGPKIFQEFLMVLAKICTFFVVKEYRGQHVATKMLEYIFEYLGTSKPLITITDYKVLSFVPIIKKYNWKLTQITSKGYYNNASCEFVYNGRLPE